MAYHGFVARRVSALKSGQVTKKHFAQLALWCFLSMLAAVDANAEIYKYHDANGRLILTDSPPPDAGEVDKIQPTINTAIPTPGETGAGNATTAAEEAEQKKLEEKRAREQKLREMNERMELRRQLEKELKAARSHLKQLKEQRKLDEVPRPGERQYSAITNRSWLNESYFKRLEALDHQIAEAEKAVKNAKENLRLRRRVPREEVE